MFVVCPECREPLADDGEALTCHRGHSFARRDGVIDFLGYDPLDADTHTPDCKCELSGMLWRTENYILPWLRKNFGALDGLRVLEDGCGIGNGVEFLAEQGVDAYGIDPGQRTDHWPDIGRLFIADGTQLPFADCSFDAVLSTGVLEHVGEPRPRREQHPFQRRYMEEIVRVLRPGGMALIAHPNGAHPFDYWHPRRFSIRPHWPYEAWMPNAFEVRSWVGSSPHETQVRFLTPEGYLAFERVEAHWYGRAFGNVMQTMFRAISRFPRLATTPLNPWLVSEIRRTG